MYSRGKQKTLVPRTEKNYGTGFSVFQNLLGGSSQLVTG